MQDIGRNTPTTVEIGQRVSPSGATLCQQVEIFKFLVPRSHPRAPIGAKFCTVKRSQMPLDRAKFH